MDVTPDTIILSLTSFISLISSVASRQFFDCSLRHRDTFSDCPSPSCEPVSNPAYASPIRRLHHLSPARVRPDTAAFKRRLVGRTTFYFRLHCNLDTSNASFPRYSTTWPANQPQSILHYHTMASDSCPSPALPLSPPSSYTSATISSMMISRYHGHSSSSWPLRYQRSSHLV